MTGEPPPAGRATDPELLPHTVATESESATSATSAPDMASPSTRLSHSNTAESAADHEKRLAHGVGISALTLAAYSVRAVYGILVARLLGGEALGTYVLSFAWIDLLSQAGTMGLDTAALVAAARMAAGGNPDGARRVLRQASMWALCAAALIAAALAVVIAYGIVEVDSPVARSLLFMAPAVPALALSRVSSTTARGAGVMHVDLVAQGLVGTAAMLVALLVGYRAGLGAPSAALGTTAGAIAAAIVAWTMSSRAVQGASRGGVRDTRVASDTTALAATALPAAGVSALHLLVMRLDIIILGHFTSAGALISPVELGAYAAAADLAGSLRKLRQLFDGVFAPMASEAIALGRLDRLRSSLGQAGRWVLLLACPAAGLAVLSGGLALRLYSPAFVVAAPALAILTIATASHGFLGLLESVIMAKRPALNLMNTSFAVAVQFAVTWLLVPRVGLVGAASGALAAYLVLALLRTRQLGAVVGLEMPWMDMTRPFQAAGVALLLGFVVRLVGGGPGGQAGAAVIFVATYVVMLRWLRLPEGDRALLDVLRGRARRRAT